MELAKIARAIVNDLTLAQIPDVCVRPLRCAI